MSDSQTVTIRAAEHAATAETRPAWLLTALAHHHRVAAGSMTTTKHQTSRRPPPQKHNAKPNSYTARPPNGTMH